MTEDSTKSPPLKDTELTRENVILKVPHAPAFTDCHDCRVVHISPGAVCKYGTRVTSHEAANLRAVKGHVNAPVVFDCWVHDGQTFLLEEYLNGERLDTIWRHMKKHERRDLVIAVAQQLEKLQKIPVAHPGPQGGPPNARCNSFYFTYYGAGPFKNRAELQAWFKSRLDVVKRLGRVEKTTPDLEVKSLVMGFLDLNWTNILVHKGQPYFVDWHFAGGYPAWLEKATLAKTNGNSKEEVVFLEMLLAEFQPKQWASELRTLDDMTWALTTGAGMDNPYLER